MPPAPLGTCVVLRNALPAGLLPRACPAPAPAAPSTRSLAPRLPHPPRQPRPCCGRRDDRPHRPPRRRHRPQRRLLPATRPRRRHPAQHQSRTRIPTMNLLTLRPPNLLSFRAPSTAPSAPTAPLLRPGQQPGHWPCEPQFRSASGHASHNLRAPLGTCVVLWNTALPQRTTQVTSDRKRNPTSCPRTPQPGDARCRAIMARSSPGSPCPRTGRHRVTRPVAGAGVARTAGRPAIRVATDAANSCWAAPT